MRPNYGFTLLEILVAMALTALVLLGVARLSGSGIGLQEETAFTSMAAILAESRMSAIAAKSELQTGFSNGSFGENNPNFSYAETISKVPDRTELYNIRIQIFDSDLSRNAFVADRVMFHPGENE